MPSKEEAEATTAASADATGTREADADVTNTDEQEAQRQAEEDADWHAENPGRVYVRASNPDVGGEGFSYGQRTEYSV